MIIPRSQLIMYSLNLTLKSSLSVHSDSEGRDEVKKLVGRRAPDEYLDGLRLICENHHPHAELDGLRGYHIGRNFLVEVKMIMDKETTLEVS